MKNLLLFSFLIISICAQAQITNDPSFDSKVTAPAYKNNSGPKVLIEGGHHNVIVQWGLIKPLNDLIHADGYNPKIDSLPITKKYLSDYKIVVMNPSLPFDFGTKKEVGNLVTFSKEEIENIYNYVNNGGSLFVLIDCSPTDIAMSPLLNKFGIKTSFGTLEDSVHQDKEFGKVVVQYTKENGLLKLNHPILKGTNENEIIKSLVLYTGSAIKSDQLTTILPISNDAKINNNGVATSLEKGYAQGLAGKVGKGKIVVLSDSEAFVAMLFGKNKAKIGMQVKAYDNKQFALNILHWLTK